MNDYGFRCFRRLSVAINHEYVEPFYGFLAGLGWERLPRHLDHYNGCMSLGLAASEKSDLIQYLVSLRF